MRRWDYAWLVWSIALTLAILLAALLFNDSALRLGLMGVALGLLSALLGFLAITMAHRSDDMMRATASADFFEKQAVLHTYARDIEVSASFDLFRAGQLLGDVRAAHQLRRWAPLNQRRDLSDTIEFVRSRITAADQSGTEADWLAELAKLSEEIRSER